MFTHRRPSPVEAARFQIVEIQRLKAGTVERVYARLRGQTA